MSRPVRRPPTPEGAKPAARRDPPVEPDRPAPRELPARQVKQGAFDDSVAGEEDPGAGVDTLTPRHGR